MRWGDRKTDYKTFCLLGSLLVTNGPGQEAAEQCFFGSRLKSAPGGSAQGHAPPEHSNPEEAVLMADRMNGLMLLAVGIKIPGAVGQV